MKPTNKKKEKQPFISFIDPLYSYLKPYSWPKKYPEYLQDRKIILSFLFRFSSKEAFFERYKISETLIKHTSTWSLSHFALSFIYHYIIDQLNKNNYVLTTYDWSVVLKLSINPVYSNDLFKLLEKNKFTNFSRKEWIIDGAIVSLNLSTDGFDLTKPSEISKSLENLLRFLQVSEDSLKIVINSIFIDKNPIKIQQFLKNHKWFEQQKTALRSATEYLRNFAFEKKALVLLFNNFWESKRNQLEEFNVWDAFASYEENVNRIYSLALSDSYFLLFTDFLTNPESQLLEIFNFFEVQIRNKHPGFESNSDSELNSKINFKSI